MHSSWRIKASGAWRKEAQESRGSDARWVEGSLQQGWVEEALQQGWVEEALHQG
jgi:hypothetical protein